MNAKVIVVFYGALVAAALPAVAAGSSKPNILLLVADDLGWADVEWHGAKFHTPVLDRLVRDGWKLIVRKATKKNKAGIELFNVTADPFEEKDLAQAEPERVKQLQAILADLRAGDLKEIPRDAGDGVVDKAD
ncbi:MAG: hypothetical protein WC740_11190 [Verrucomicrobiia bacterium]